MLKIVPFTTSTRRLPGGFYCRRSWIRARSAGSGWIRPQQWWWTGGNLLRWDSWSGWNEDRRAGSGRTWAASKSRWTRHWTGSSRFRPEPSVDGPNSAGTSPLHSAPQSRENKVKKLAPKKDEIQDKLTMMRASIISRPDPMCLMPKWRSRSCRNRRCSFHNLPSVLMMPAMSTKRV